MGIRSPLRSLVVLVAAVTLALPTAAQQSIDPDRAAFAALVDETLDLSSSLVFSLEVTGAPGEPIRATVPLHGTPFTLDLAPFSTRSATDYKVLVQDETGALVEAEPSPVRTLRGVVEGIPESMVAATYDESGGLYARIRVPVTGEEFWVEQLASKMDGVAPDVHVVYTSEAVQSPEGGCGVTGLPTIEVPHTHGGKVFGSAPACGVGLCLAQLGCDADVEYYQANGSSVTNVENKINSVINAMNMQYEDEVDIRHDITTIVVRTSNPDPYNATSISGLLSDLRAEWQGPLAGTPHDTAQLFTGQNLSGGVIGIAWLSGVCGSLRYSVVENFSSNFACTTDLSAHELGHNWSAGHCSCPNFTMNPSITCANTFSAVSINSISNFRDSVNCLNGGGPPSADFTADKTVGPAPLSVRFSDASDGAYTDWLWDFGDGQTSTDDSPMHTYLVKGDYTVSLTVSGPAGTDTTTKVDYIDVTDTVFDFDDLGGQTAWQFGIEPELTASSTLLGGDSFDLQLKSAPSSALCVAWLAFASAPVSAFGGTVFPNPPAQQFFFSTNFLGALNLSTTWPAGVPAGTDLFLQFFIATPFGVDGVVLSNGITATTP